MLTIVDGPHKTPGAGGTRPPHSSLREVPKSPPLIHRFRDGRQRHARTGCEGALPLAVRTGAGTEPQRGAYVVALSRDFTDVHTLRLSGAAAEVPQQTEGVLWIRNGFAVDEHGGIYIASNSHLHKVVWTGS
jgi:hypothetical protein